MQSADANLILALDALLREGSVTGAARRMSVTAPAMSHTLARLRDVLADPLFVRAGNRLVPTPRAVALRERVAHAAAEVAAVLAPERPLDLATLDRAFVLRASDAIVTTVGRALDARIRDMAPRVSLHFVGVPTDGEIDLDIGVQHGRGPDVHVQRLYVDDLVPLVRRNHPLARRRLASLKSLEQIVVLTKPQSRWPKRPPGRVVPSFLTAASLLGSSDAYALIPSRLAAEVLGPFGLRALVVAAPSPKITIAQAWSSRLDSDAAHTWLRREVRAACAGNRRSVTE